MKRFVRGPSSENEWHGPRPSERSPEVLLERFGCDGLELPEVHASIVESWQEDFVASMLDVRMLFSCVVDADYIETEAHREAVDTSTKRYRPQGPLLDSHRALASVLGYIEEVRARTHADPAILELRQDLLQACLQAAESPRGLFTLTAPTGAGKTLAMLAFALKHAATHGLRRIICVIPYLTIIEQTVEVYRKALGKACQHVQPMSYVLEDHSLAGIRSRARRTSTEATTADADQAEDASRLLAENWDAPVIVTTSVQFLESLFANRPGACRKLHRIAESVILFDEVQTLPTRLVEPTLAALSRLAHRYGCSVVLATATQPAFDHLHEHVRKYFRAGWQPTEIVPPSLRLFDRARRVEVKWPVDETKSLTWEALAERLLEHDQALCIVNLKRHAADLFDRLFSSQPDAQV
ncbi:MAG: DEAD/DEAH box helicase, partial [Armatimonadetes bacterium]|nr:DEAD/DEAH box helicase [Armatimonadota bacterium]